MEVVRGMTQPTYFRLDRQATKIHISDVQSQTQSTVACVDFHHENKRRVSEEIMQLCTELKENVNQKVLKREIEMQLAQIYFEYDEEQRAKEQQAQKKREEKKRDKNNAEEPKKTYYVCKYSGCGYLVESVVIAGKPSFVRYIGNEVSLLDSIEEPSRLLKPFDEVSNAAEPYSFESIEELQDYIERAKSANLDYLFKCAYWFVDACNDSDLYNKNILTAAIIFSCFQDRLPSTFYLFPVGKPGSGKGAMLTTFKLLGYRVVPVSSTTAANIYNVLGTVEKGQVTLTIDEANTLDEQEQFKDILKSGHKASGKVPRILDASSSKRVQEFYLTYCFKMISAEREMKEWKAEGLLTRIFTLHCIAGSPRFIVDKVEETSGDPVYDALKRKFVDLHKLLFAYRLVHYSDSVPDLCLNLEGREAELAGPLIRLFRGSVVLDTIKATLFHFISEKRQRKVDGIDYEVFSVVKELVDNQIENEVVLESSTITEAIKTRLQGIDIQDKPLSFMTKAFGEISRSRIADILTTRFGADAVRIGRSRTRGYSFDKKKVERAGRIYKELGTIEILPPCADSVDALDTYPGDNTAFLEDFGVGKSDSNDTEEPKVAPSVVNPTQNKATDGSRSAAFSVQKASSPSIASAQAQSYARAVATDGRFDKDRCKLEPDYFKAIFRQLASLRPDAKVQHYALVTTLIDYVKDGRKFYRGEPLAMINQMLKEGWLQEVAGEESKHGGGYYQETGK